MSDSRGHFSKKVWDFRSMSAPPRVRSVDSSDREFRSVLGPAGNKLQKKPVDDKTKNQTFTASPAKKMPQCSPLIIPSILRRNGISMTASYSSDASSSCESSPLSMASTSSGKRALRRNGSVSSSSSSLRRNLTEERDEKAGGSGDCFSDGRKRCAWITPKSGNNPFSWSSNSNFCCRISWIVDDLLMILSLTSLQDLCSLFLGIEFGS